MVPVVCLHLLPIAAVTLNSFTWASREGFPSSGPRFTNRFVVASTYLSIISLISSSPSHYKQSTVNNMFSSCRVIKYPINHIPGKKIAMHHQRSGHEERIVCVGPKLNRSSCGRRRILEEVAVRRTIMVSGALGRACHTALKTSFHPSAVYGLCV